MKKIIFNKGFGAYDPPEAFILSDKDLTVALENLPAPAAVGEHHIIFVNEDGEERKHKLSGNDVITLSRGFLKPGQLLGKVMRIMRGKTVRTWEIEPLIIAQLDTDITVSPVIAAFKAELAQVKETYEAQERLWHAKFKTLNDKFDTLIKDVNGDITSINNTLNALNDYMTALTSRIDASIKLLDKFVPKKRK